MLPLPTKLPDWYTVKTDKPDDEKGWTPETGDIPDIRETWNGKAQPPSRRTPDVQLNNLQIISPIQVGGGSFTEGGILPAQFSGVPCIPGSSLRGAFLHWLREHRETLKEEERRFWQTLVAEDWNNWQPRQVRFESVPLKNLQPYPLNAQQEWQIFWTEENEGTETSQPARPKPVTKKQKARQQEKDSRKLGIQWQAAPRLPSQRGTENISVRAFFKNSLNPQEQEWFEQRLGQMLQQQGVGRGTASGFGRMAKEIPTGTWQIELKGMKPCSLPHQPKHNRRQRGEYRWSPQVLRACLRGYFTRLALSLMSKEKALALTNAIFGRASCRGQLTLTSYLAEIESPGEEMRSYANIPATVAGETWHIQVNCNEQYRELVGLLLELASQLGGLGPGWRRPPHSFKKETNKKETNKKETKQSHVWLYRGSEFAVTPANGENLENLIARLQDRIRQLANLPAHSPTRPVPGGLISIWEAKDKGKWWTIVHKVCSTSQAQNHKPVNRALEKPKPKRPCWCGDSEKRPSGYSVRQHEDCCYITVFDRAVEETLRQKGFRRIWREQEVS